MHRLMLKNMIKVGAVFGIAAVSLLLFGSMLSSQTAMAEVNVPQAVDQITGTLEFNAVGSIDLAGAEIVAFDPGSDQFYVTSGDGLQIIDGSDPTAMSLVTTIDPTSLGFDNSEFTSVAVAEGVVAAALPALTETNPGFVLFFDVTGTLQSSVTVGSLPDMLTFTPDGSQALVAIEGQPDVEDPQNIDPEGGIAIIDISGGVATPTLTSLDFTGFTTATVELAVRLFEGKTVAEDVEPEYITVSPDGETAVATLQEANSIAVIDLTVPEISSIVPLGLKDHSLEGNGLDASNEDGAINIQNWPVLGMYMPDAIASYEVDGTLYLVTANEGDARDAYGDDERIANLVLDPNVFTDVMELKLESNLGRLNASNIDGINGSVTGFSVSIDGAQAGTDSEAEGSGQFVLSGTQDVLSYTMRVEGLDFGTVATGVTTTESISDDVVSMHLHIGASDTSGGIALGMISPAQDDNFTVTLNSDGSATLVGAWDLTDTSTIALGEFISNTQAITVGNEVPYYINIHTTAFTGGEIRGQLEKANVYAELYTYGARSFTIWNAGTGAVVYDSGDDFEQILAETNPLFFNANNGSPDDFDERSDDKGPEPEGVTLGTINSTTYAFIGNERADGSIYVFDVTSPISPTYVARLANLGSIAPEGLLFISAEDSPTSNPLLAVTYEVSNELVVYEITESNGNFKLQLLHASDLEGGNEAIGDAKRFAAVVEGLEFEALNNGYSSIILSAGDNYIPGPFFGASDSFDMRPAFVEVYGSYFGVPSDINNFREAAGRADITIMNIVGFDASVMGNHEFDAGTNAIETIIGPDVRDTNVRWAGSQFPYLSANLDFSSDSNLSSLYSSDIITSSDSAVLPLSTDLFTATANAPKIAPAAYIDVDGEVIGVVGATTPILASISSPGDTKVISGGSNDMTILASIINPVIAEISANTDKI
ncbi:MAG: choice-of-anchor I family protein, partial [Chloroflexota bacterium]